MTQDIVSELMAPSGATLKFTEEGQVHSIVVEKFDKKQATDFMSGEPQTWDNGEPKWQFVVAGTSEGDAAKLYIKGWGGQLAALQEALRAAGITESKQMIGGTLTVKWASTDEPTRPGLSGAKRFKMKFERSTKSSIDEDLF